MIELEGRNWSFPANTKLLAGMVSAVIAPIVVLATVVAVVLAVANQACAQSAAVPYPKMAAMDQYLMAPDAEVALARSAAPDSISKDADVLVLDRHGYQTAIKGHNGFVCLVQRSWTAPIDDPNFWNPKLRGPICLNPAAVRSFLPRVVKRTTLVLAGKTKEQLSDGMKAAFQAKEIPAIEPGSMGYMLSKQGYLGDQNGHWHPHIMIFLPPAEETEWGANLPGSPIFGSSDPTDRLSVFFIPVAKWSDGSADSGESGSH
jgi:hypothetical protein